MTTKPCCGDCSACSKGRTRASPWWPRPPRSTRARGAGQLRAGRGAARPRPERHLFARPAAAAAGQPGNAGADLYRVARRCAAGTGDPRRRARPAAQGRAY
ncbi:hypothetical protein LP420_31145 [Massilia sp. B-10]|nr:hypothetical protein LP420_31145 [Massilia sp. B-10]